MECFDQQKDSKGDTSCEINKDDEQSFPNNESEKQEEMLENSPNSVNAVNVSNTTIADSSEIESDQKHENRETVSFKIIYNKSKHDVTVPLDDTIGQFKQHLETVIGVPKALQKVMFKGLARDEQTLRIVGITSGAKVMIVGSKLDDVLAVSGVSKEESVETEKTVSTKEPLCRQKIHRKILDKGVPDDAMPGLLDIKESLPSRPLSGMLNKNGGKVRLTFKLEQDQVWLGTRERTEKLAMSSIKSVVSEPIEGFEHYHIMGLQLGPTEASRYWIYWVPAQYVDAIKDAILGKWQYF